MLGDGLLKSHAPALYAELIAIVPARIKRYLQLYDVKKARMADAARLALALDAASQLIGHVTISADKPPQPADETRFDSKLILDAGRLGFQLRKRPPVILNAEENAFQDLIDPITNCATIALMIIGMQLFATPFSWAEAAICSNGLLEVAAVVSRSIVAEGVAARSIEWHDRAIGSVLTFVGAIAQRNDAVADACAAKLPHLCATILQPLFDDEMRVFNVNPTTNDPMTRTMRTWLFFVERLELDVAFDLHRPKPPSCWARDCDADGSARPPQQCAGCRIATFCSREHQIQSVARPSPR